MEMRIEDLLAERDNLKHECNILHEKVCRLEEEKEKLMIQMESLEKDLEKQKRISRYEEGRAEAYAHCIDAMNGIQHEKKSGVPSC